ALILLNRMRRKWIASRTTIGVMSNPPSGGMTRRKGARIGAVMASNNVATWFTNRLRWLITSKANSQLNMADSMIAQVMSERMVLTSQTMAKPMDRTLPKYSPLLARPSALSKDSRAGAMIG